MEIGRGGACVPARVALQGRPSLKSSRTMRVFLVWKRRYANVRAGTQAPPLRFRLDVARGRLMSFGWIACKWLFCLCRIVWKNITERGRGGACVPARVPHKGASIVKFPAYNVCIFGMETPLRRRSGGHIGTAPTVSFGWIACGRLISFGWIACGWFCLIVGETVHKNQHHRCCTFVSPGLPTKGGYPG